MYKYFVSHNGLIDCLFQLSNVSKRVSVVEEDDPMDDEFNMTRTQQHGDDTDLFEDKETPHTSTNGSHGAKGDWDTSTGPGESSYIFTFPVFCGE